MGVDCRMHFSFQPMFSYRTTISIILILTILTCILVIRDFKTSKRFNKKRIWKLWFSKFENQLSSKNTLVAFVVALTVKDKERKHTDKDIESINKHNVQQNPRNVYPKCRLRIPSRR